MALLDGFLGSALRYIKPLDVPQAPKAMSSPMPFFNNDGYGVTITPGPRTPYRPIDDIGSFLTPRASGMTRPEFSGSVGGSPSFADQSTNYFSGPQISPTLASSPTSTFNFSGLPNSSGSGGMNAGAPDVPAYSGSGYLSRLSSTPWYVLALLAAVVAGAIYWLNKK